jgi:hypothetical protein
MRILHPACQGPVRTQDVKKKEKSIFICRFHSQRRSLTSSVSELILRIRLTLKMLSEERVMAPPGLWLRAVKARLPKTLWLKVV